MPHELRHTWLREETETVPDLGTVYVRGLPLSKKLEIGNMERTRQMPALLAATVLTEDGKPVMDIDDWDAYASAHEEPFNRLFAIAARVSGLIPDDAKKH